MIRVIMRVIGAVAIVTALGMGPAAMASYINSNGVNCRATPDTGARVVAKLSKGQSVTVAEGGGGWSRIEKPSCWVSSRFLSTDYVAQSPHVSSRNYEGFRSSALSASRRQSSSNLYAFKGSNTKKTKRKSTRSRPSKRRSSGSGFYGGSGCPCSGGTVCIGPRGGRYCITSGGNKRYGV